MRFNALSGVVVLGLLTGSTLTFAQDDPAAGFNVDSLPTEPVTTPSSDTPPVVQSNASAAEAQPAASAAAPVKAPNTPPAVPATTQASVNTPAAAIAPVVPTAKPVDNSKDTASMVVTKDTAADALKAKKTDVTKQKDLEQVFNQNLTYSLAKKGSYSANYSFDYTFYRDTSLDLALDDGSTTITRLRVNENATHAVTNTFDLQYGIKDNLTIGASLPIVAKIDTLMNSSAAGLGDIGLNLRWEPFALESGKLPLTIFGSLSTKTGDSPYEIPANASLSTGKGYYSLGGGASTRKYFDPVVLFTSASVGFGLPVSGLNQIRGTRVLTEFSPGINAGFAFGFAYSLNYDVSLTMSFQQSFSGGSQFTFSDRTVAKPGVASSATMNIAMGLRVSSKTVVNGSVGFGLTADAPDVILGVSLPLDFTGFGRVVK